MWIVLGLTGPFGSGCSTLANVLKEELNFRVIRISDYIRAVAVKTGLMDVSKARMSKEEVDRIIETNQCVVRAAI